MILKRKTGLEDVCVLYLRWRYELIKLIDYCINAANLSRRIDEMCAMGVEVSVELFLYPPCWHRNKNATGIGRVTAAVCLF